MGENGRKNFIFKFIISKNKNFTNLIIFSRTLGNSSSKEKDKEKENKREKHKTHDVEVFAPVSSSNVHRSPRSLGELLVDKVRKFRYKYFYSPSPTFCHVNFRNESFRSQLSIKFLLIFSG